MSKEVKIMLGIALLLIIGGVILSGQHPQPDQPGKPVDSKSLARENSHMTGSKDAKVTIVEFGDYQCPACRVAHPILKQVLNEYQDNSDVNFVFRNFPLASIHRNAMIAAEAAEASAAQGKFWEMHDLLYDKQSEWSESSNPLDIFVGYAGQLGLDANKFKQQVQQNKFADIIQTDLSDGTALGVNSTPTFYINGEILTGYQYELLKAKIEDKLK